MPFEDEDDEEKDKVMDILKKYQPYQARRDAVSFRPLLEKQTKPISKSIELLKSIVHFWRKDHNKYLVYKDKGDKYNVQKYKKRRQEQVEKVYKKFTAELQMVDFIFTVREIQTNEISDEEYSELAKQCFFVNIYNALILYKLAEIVSYNFRKVFGLKNHNSWLALEQNSRITISQRNFSAYQIRHEIIQNIGKQSPSNFSVDPAYLHPLIEYAFFMPKNGSIKLSELVPIFKDVYSFKNDFWRIVNDSLKDKLCIKESFTLIRMPCHLRHCIKQELLVTPLEYHTEKYKRQQNEQDSSCMDTQKHLGSADLQRIKQMQILEILTFLQKHMMYNGAVPEGIKDNRAVKLTDGIKTQIQKTIQNIQKALQSNKSRSPSASGHILTALHREKNAKGVQPSANKSNQSSSNHSDSQINSALDSSGSKNKVPMTEYQIEWISPKYLLKPEKLFDGLDQAYSDILSQY